MRFVSVGGSANRFLSGVWAVLILGSCTSVIPYHEAQIELTDQKTAPYPPKSVELIKKQDFIFFEAFPNSLTSKQEEFLKILKDQILKHGHLQQLPESRIQHAKQQVLSLKDEQAVLKFGQLLKTRYVGIFQFTDHPETDQKPADALIQIKIYQVSPERLILQTGVYLQKTQEDSLKEGLKLRVQKALPQRGFILETKANRTWIKISLGKQDKIRNNRRFRIYRRTFDESTNEKTVKSQLSSKKERNESQQAVVKTAMTTVKRERLSEVGQAVVKIVKQRHAFAVVEQSDRHRILSGDVVVAQPE